MDTGLFERSDSLRSTACGSVDRIPTRCILEHREESEDHEEGAECYRDGSTQCGNVALQQARARRLRLTQCDEHHEPGRRRTTACKRRSATRRRWETAVGDQPEKALQVSAGGPVAGGLKVEGCISHRSNPTQMKGSRVSQTCPTMADQKSECNVTVHGHGLQR